MSMTVRAEDTTQDGAAADSAVGHGPAGPHALAGCRAPGGGRPVRRAAARKRQRILTAAARVFTERGLDATLDEVAREAGVGIGTVYRRFPDKESIVTELFRERIDSFVTVAEQACAHPDPWQGLVSYLEFAASVMAVDRGLRQLMMFGTYDRDQVCYARDRMNPVITRLVERAQASGDLRDDFRSADVKMIAFMLASSAEYAAAVAPEVWRRYLTLVIDGLRPSRDGVTALPVPAPSTVDLGLLMRPQGQRPAHRR